MTRTLRLGLPALFAVLVGCTTQGATEFFEESNERREACINYAADVLGRPHNQISASYVDQNPDGTHNYAVSAGLRTYNCLVDNNGAVGTFVVIG